MIKKNANERRFNTAAARIMISSKLPHDFFMHSREKDSRESSLYSHRLEDAEKNTKVNLLNEKDPLLFTFRRSSSEDKFRFKETPFVQERSLPKNKSNKGFQTKLPPVSCAVPKENMKLLWGCELRGTKEKLKKLGRINTRILQESNLIREQISEVIG
jgi:hypothetical protein